MSLSAIIFSPFGIFLLFLAVSYLIYLLGGALAPAGVKSDGKNKMYACGEDLPEKQHNPSASMFFHVALYFTIMDVAAMTLATLPSGDAGYLGILYIVGIMVAVFALILG